MEIDWSKFFESFGIDLEHVAGSNQLIGVCPFSGKKKFFVNEETGQWDSKVDGSFGNSVTFLRRFHDHLVSDTAASDFGELADAKKLPIEAFIGKVLYNRLNKQYIIPAVSREGKVADLCRWGKGFPGIMRSVGSELHLMFADRLYSEMKEDKSADVCICEGEFDAIALSWLFSKTKRDMIVVAVPGASTFKTPWVELFRDRNVILCYDNDKAGKNGETKAYNLLTNVAKSIRMIEWPEGFPDKYDIRDLIIDSFGKIPFDMRKAMKVVEQFDKMTQAKYPRAKREEMAAEAAKKKPTPGFATPQKEDAPYTLLEVEAKYTRWLKMKNIDPLIFLAGVAFANRISGDPIWAFLVAPPGGSKTELLMTFTESPTITTATTLTSSSLISGMRMPDGMDPSLIPKLDGQILVVKDFTSILTINPMERDEIFGILRDCYDGFTEKMFGNGVHRKYESSFGILAGVTPQIDVVQALNTSMGERFIKYRMDKTLTMEDEHERLMRVLGNVSHEVRMRKELKEIGKRILDRQLPEVLPSFKKWHNEIASLAMFTAKLRGAVNIDRFSREMTSKPIQEIATRLTKVYSKLAIGMAVFMGNDEVGETEMRVLRQVAKDTVPEMLMDMFDLCHALTIEKKKFCFADISARLRTNEATIRKIAEDFRIMGVVDKVAGEERVKTWWRVSDKFLSLCEKAGMGVGEVPAMLPVHTI